MNQNVTLYSTSLVKFLETPVTSTHVCVFCLLVGVNFLLHCHGDNCRVLFLVEFVCYYDTIFVTSTKMEVMRSGCFMSFCLSVCLSVCVQAYCKSNQPISLTVAVTTKPTDRKNWLTFGGHLILNVDS